MLQMIFLILPLRFLIIMLSYNTLVYSYEYGLEKITAKNYEKILDKRKDAYILVVKNVDKIPFDELIEAEFRLRGLFTQVGIIEPREYGAFLKRKGFLDNNSYPIARVFPYGGRKVKLAGMKDVRSLKDAKITALHSLPDETTRIQTTKQLEYFVHSSYSTSPPRFPVILFTGKQRTSAIYKALSLKYATYFNFGLTRNPSRDFLQKFTIQSLPTLIVMISKVVHNKQLIFSSIPFDVRSYGPISYLNVAKFLYSVHEKHWNGLPNMEKFKDAISFKEKYIEDTKDILTLDANFEEKTTPNHVEIQEITPQNNRYLCGDKTLGLCIIVFLDTYDETTTKNSFELMNDVQNILRNIDIPVQYLWVDGTCHPEYGQVFGIFPESFPALLIAKPRQRLFITQSLKDTLATKISKLVTAILKGETKLQTYARFNEMLSANCLKSNQQNKENIGKRKEL